MADATEDNDLPTNRFKHQSYNQTLKEVHLPSTFNQKQYEQDIGDNNSHFHEALIHWRQLNLAPSFITFANKADPLSSSMPMLLHNWREIIDLWINALLNSDDEGLKALLDLLQKIVYDMRTTLSPVYPTLLGQLLKLLPRSLSAPALTSLIETFSTLFKYLLVPSIHLELLDQTWFAIRSTLPNCISEVQRAMAEVWGSLLRRLKSAARQKAVCLLSENAEEISDSSAWIMVYACKSVSQTLHTTSVSIFMPLLDSHLSTSSPSITFTIIRRTMTALIHHVKSADQFAPVADCVIHLFSSTLEATDFSSSSDLERLRRMLEVISVLCSVRGGSRLQEPQITKLFTHLNAMQIHPALHHSLLKCSTSLFVASNMSHWLGPGLKFLQQSWEYKTRAHSLSFVLQLYGCFSDINWGGWKIVALPLLIKATAKIDLLNDEPVQVLRLLAALKKAKKLGTSDVDLVWKTKIQDCAVGRLKTWTWTMVEDETAAELNDILALSPFFSPEISVVLTDVINKLLDLPDTVNKTSISYSGWALGASMQALAKRRSTEWVNQVDLTSWTRRCIEKWAWSTEVLSGLVDLAHACPSISVAMSGSEAYAGLRDSLISHSQRSRLYALRLLDSALVETPAGAEEVIRRCVQGEEVFLDVQGVRERVLRIGRVGQVVGDEVGADICVRWLIAQLKVNLRPLWSPASVALSSLSQRFGETVWKLLFLELQGLSQAIQAKGTIHEEVGQESDLDTNDDPWEEERSWRDPSAHNIRATVSKWGDPIRMSKELLKTLSPEDRFDPHSYEFQILSTLSECSSLAEKHNRELVPYFLNFTSPDGTSKFPKPKLTAWLKLFSKFNNPKALHSTDTLKTLYLSLLSHPDRTIQTISLTCLLAYKSQHLSSHDNKLRILLDDTRWRDELTTLDIESFEPQERPEVVDVVIRMLFGMMTEKKGRIRGADRRIAVLTALGGCSSDELGLLVDLMLRPLGYDRHSHSEVPFTLTEINSYTLDKQKLGFLNLLGDVLKVLGPRLSLYWPALLGTVINVVGDSQSRVDSSIRVDDNEDNLEEEIDDDIDTVSSLKIVRTLRQLGLKRLASFFKISTSFDYISYLRAACSSFISPRLPSLDRENTQAPSALLDLFRVWSLDIHYNLFLVDFDPMILPKIYDCLVATNVKPSVLSCIFDIVERLLLHSSNDTVIRDSVLKPHVSHLLNNIATLVEQSKDVNAVNAPLYHRQISILSEIAPYSTDGSQASTLFKLFTPLLRKPNRIVPEKLKMDLVKIIGDLLPLIPDMCKRESTTHQNMFLSLSQLFQSLRSRPARTSLLSTFHRLASVNISLQDLVELLDSLNAYSARRIDEPDFDRRLKAFSSLNENLHQSFLPSNWIPVLYNMLHFIQDPVELAIRNNASFTMRLFIDAVSLQKSPEIQSIFVQILFPGLKNGLRAKDELVRSEILGVIAYAVANCKHITTLQEMQVLLENGDEEANFFNNILHIQIHRRSRALRRLADHCDEGAIRSTTLAEIFIPLVANYIASTSSIDHHLVNDAIAATGRIAKHLSWGAYHALVQKYLKLSRAKDASERVYIRTLVAILDNFHFTMEDAVINRFEPENLEDDEESEETQIDNDVALTSSNIVSVDPAKSYRTAKISDAVSSRLLPDLLSHLEKYDATTDDNTRIPIATGIVAVAKYLPASSRALQIQRLVTILCQIFRSRSQETRDLARDTLNRIAVSIGPTYLPIILRELRGALIRGPQLHVLAYVTHALMIHISSEEHAKNFCDLDECVNDVAFISAEVIFGESGKDVQAEDFKTKMREVRTSSSKGMDSFTIMAKFITPSKISSLLAPLRAIMHETGSVKTLQLVEDVLRRIALGLNSNQRLIATELLVLCHTLITQNAQFLKQAPSRKSNPKKNDVIVQTKRHAENIADHYVNNSYRFVCFGLDLLHTALRRNRFDFHDLNVMARLETMVVVVGNILYSINAAILLPGLRCIAGLVKCPLKSLDKALPVLVRQVLDIIKQAGNTESELAQVAFKSLATILRDGPAVQVKEKDLVYLLELLAPDIEEPDRQAPVFTILRAIVARKFVVPEIYDIMEKVAEIAVTSQSVQVQELCRGVLLQFLLDYPQGKGRLKNQMAFLAKNLSYVHESGRKSVMELLSAVVAKFQGPLVAEYAELLFVALVMVVANDDSTRCREMASQLIKELFVRLEQDQRNSLLSHLHAWATQGSQYQLIWVSIQVYGFLVDAVQTEAQAYVQTILADINSAITKSADDFLADEAEAKREFSMNIVPAWQLPYHALTVLTKILRIFPIVSVQEDKVNWLPVITLLLFPHAWVRTASCRLIGLLFAAVPVAAPRASGEDLLSIERMRGIADSLTQQLKSDYLDEALGLQIVKNLFYLGKCFDLIALSEKDDGNDHGNMAIEEEPAEETKFRSHPLPWLFSKLSYQIRSSHISRRNKAGNGKPNWSQQPLAVLRWFAAMASHMEATRLEKYLVHVLTPVYRLIEDDTIRDSSMNELKTVAIELQDIIQAKVGTTKFSTVYSQIRQGALGVQRERKVARAVRVTNDPEAASRRKMQRNMAKKESRKRKERSFVDGKGKVKRRREE